MIFNETPTGLAVASYHGLNVVGVVNGIDFGTGNVKALTDDDSGNVIISIGIIFEDGEIEDPNLRLKVSKADFPNVALYADDNKNTWNEELKTWFVQKLVVMTGGQLLESE